MWDIDSAQCLRKYRRSRWRPPSGQRRSFHLRCWSQPSVRRLTIVLMIFQWMFHLPSYVDIAPSGWYLTPLIHGIKKNHPSRPSNPPETHGLEPVEEPRRMTQSPGKTRAFLAVPHPRKGGAGPAHDQAGSVLVPAFRCRTSASKDQISIANSSKDLWKVVIYPAKVVIYSKNLRIESIKSWDSTIKLHDLIIIPSRRQTRLEKRLFLIWKSSTKEDIEE